MHKRLCGMGIVLFFLLSCQTTAVIQAKRMVPARPEIAELKSLAVSEFYFFGDNPFQVNERLRVLVEAKLSETGFFIVKQLKTSSQKRTLPLLFKRRLTKEGIAEGIDALVSGEIDIARVEPVRLSAEGLQQKQYSLVLNLNVIQTSSQKRILGERFVTREVVEITEDEIFPDDEELMMRTIDHMAEKIVDSLTPHGVTHTIQLLRTKRTSSGVTYAQEGEWSAALSAWEQALTLNPNDHHVLYNLGAGHEFLALYPEAKNYYERSLLLSKKRKLYRNSLERVTRILKQREATSTSTLQEVPQEKEMREIPEADEP